MDYQLTGLKSKRNNGITFLLKRFLEYKRWLLLIVILLILVSLGQALIPKYVEYVVNTIIAKKDIDGLNRVGIVIGVVALFVGVFQYIQTRLSGMVSQKVLAAVRAEIFGKLQELPLRFYSQNQTGEIIQRITENVSDIDRFFQEGFLRFITILFSLITIFVFMFQSNILVAALTLLGVLTIIGFLMLQGAMLRKMNLKYLALDSGFTAFDKETLDGHKVILSYNQENTWLSRFEARNNEFLRYTKKYLLLSVTSDAFLNVATNVTTFGILFYSLYCFSTGLFSAGTVVMMMSYVTAVFNRMRGVSQIWMSLQKGLAASERLDQIMRLNSDINTAAKPYRPRARNVKGTVEFRNVTFAYDVNSDPILKNLDLVVPAGKTVAVIGPTGAGKTTFVNLIARLYDASEGSVLVDGVDVKDWDKPALRSKIGYLIQEAFLFEDTIINNLRYNNPDVTEDESLKIFDLLGAGEFIRQLPKGLETMVDSGGKNISAGQRQIVALARVLLRDPKILILDEATAKIDTKSEKMVQKAIEVSTKHVTSFIIAHRLSTIFKADLIIVINENTIVESGTHDELLAKKGVYSEMYSRFVK